MTPLLQTSRARAARLAAEASPARAGTGTRTGDHAALAIAGLRVRVADTFASRLSGLMFSRSLPEGDALLIPRCPSVHTCFMRYPIDVVYLDADGVIVRLVNDLKPWRASLGGRGAAHALELAAGSIERLGLQLDDNLNDLLRRFR